MNRQELKQLMKHMHVKQWEVADNLGMSEGNLSRLFRYELSPGDAQKIESAIMKIASNAHPPVQAGEPI